MKGIPPQILRRLRTTLLECGPFGNKQELEALFVDSRISVWRNELPEAGNRRERVHVILNFLNNKYNDAQESALVLFLYVLSEYVDAVDSCYRQLTELTQQLEHYFSINEYVEENEAHSPSHSKEPFAGPQTNFTVYVHKKGKIDQVINVEELGELNIGTKK